MKGVYLIKGIVIKSSEKINVIIKDFSDLLRKGKNNLGKQLGDYILGTGIYGGNILSKTEIETWAKL